MLAREIRGPARREDGGVDGRVELSVRVDRSALRSPARHEAGGFPLDLLPSALGLALPQRAGAQERRGRPALPQHVLQRLLLLLSHRPNVAFTASFAVYDERMDAVSSAVEARLQALLDALPDLLLRLRADGTYLEVAGDVSRLANPPNVVIGSTVGDLLPPEIAEQLMSCVRAALESGRLATVEYRLRTHLGEDRDFEVRIAPASEDEVVAIVRDVTDLHEVTRELKESRARLVAAGDAERRRVERNLHDGAQQRLVTVALHLQLIRRRLETDPSEVPILVEAAQNELTLALEEIRELVRGLHPRLLGDRGLGPALAALAERAVLPVEIVDMPSGRLPAAVEAAAYYITAEALANAAKHSRASLVTVSICGGDTDDGGRGRRQRRRWGRSRCGNRAARPCRPGRCPRWRARRLECSRAGHRASRRAPARLIRTGRPGATKHGGNARAARNTARPHSTQGGLVMDRTPVQNVARLVGIVFLLVGILGFIPGITTNLYDGLEFAGNDGNAELLGIFSVSVLHNIVHGLFGIAGLALAKTASGARTFLIGGGAIYIVLWLLGLIGGADWIPSNSADDWLHLALGGAMIAVGVALTRERRVTTTA